MSDLLLREVFLADRVVVSLGVGLDFELGQILFGGLLKVVVLVNHRRRGVPRVAGPKRNRDAAGAVSVKPAQCATIPTPSPLGQEGGGTARLVPVPLFYARLREKAWAPAAGGTGPDGRL